MMDSFAPDTHKRCFARDASLETLHLNRDARLETFIPYNILTGKRR